MPRESAEFIQHDIGRAAVEIIRHTIEQSSVGNNMKPFIVLLIILLIVFGTFASNGILATMCVMFFVSWCLLVGFGTYASKARMPS